MLLRRPHFAVLVVSAVLAVSAVLGVGAPAASAIPLGTLGATPVAIPSGGCITSTIGQGRAGGATNQSCLGAGLSFIGPSSQVSTVIGPTIITPAFTGIAITSAGSVAIGP
jgi:hypothetical protein